MSPSPSENKPMTPQELIGALQALHSAMSRAENKAARKLWKTKPEDQAQLVQCLLLALEAFNQTIDKCYAPAGGGTPPNCPPNWHEEFDVCVPNS